MSFAIPCPGDSRQLGSKLNPGQDLIRAHQKVAKTLSSWPHAICPWIQDQLAIQALLLRTSSLEGQQAQISIGDPHGPFSFW